MTLFLKKTVSCSYFIVHILIIKFNIMYMIITMFLKKFSLVYLLLCSFFILICCTCHGHSTTTDLEDDTICGLTKEQIQESLLYSNKYPIRGIAITPKCLEVHNVNNDQCLTDQNKLIECLHKEYYLAKARGNQETEPTNVFKDQQSKFHEVEEYSRKNIIEGNGELDIVARDHDGTIIKHLQSIANLTKKITCVDDLKAVLIKTKCELSIALRRQILDDNVDEMKRLGIHRNDFTEKADSSTKTKQI